MKSIVDAINSGFLCVVFRLDSRVGVRHSDGELFRSFYNGSSHTARDRLSHSGSIRAIVHHEHLQFSHVVDNDRLESMRVNVTGDLIGTITDRGVGNTTLEFTTYATVDTPGLSPRRLDTVKQVRLMANELLRPLLYNSLLDNRNRASHFEQKSATRVGESGKKEDKNKEG